MAVVTLAQLMAGVETRLQTISGLNTDDIVPGTITPPQAIVGVPDIPSYRESFGRGSWRPQLSVTVYTSKGHTQTGQLLLAEFADVTGANSIPLAIEGDRTLGLAGVDCIVTAFQTLGEEQIALIGYYGGVFTLQTIAPGT